MARYNLKLSRRPWDGLYEFTDPPATGADLTFTREQIEQSAECRIGPGRMIETVHGVYWVTPEPQPDGES